MYLWGRGIMLPTKVTTISNPVQNVSLGKDVSCAVDVKGLVWAWGPNKSGELGVGDSEERLYPFPLLDLKEKAVSVACCGDDFTVSLGSNVAMGERMTDL